MGAGRRIHGTILEEKHSDFLPVRASRNLNPTRESF